MRVHCWRMPVSDTSFVRMSAEVTEDAVLGGKLRLKQPRGGHRFGHDAILLAAACPARAGERVVDLGAGVGAAGLALSRRVDGTKLVLVEINAALAALAAENAQLNGLAARVSSVVLDVAAPAAAFAAAGLGPESAARVLMNPPFNDAARQQISPEDGRRLAHEATHETLAGWTKTAARLLHPRGSLTMIWRADGLAEVLEALTPAFGGLAVLPVYSKPRQDAIRIIVRATLSSRAPFRLLPGLTLNDREGQPTPEVEAVLRKGEGLAFFQQ